MSTIIWCDRVKHVVQESREQVAELIGSLLEDLAENNGSPANYTPPGFGYFTDDKTERQRALNVRLISSFEAVPGDAI